LIECARAEAKPSGTVVQATSPVRESSRNGRRAFPAIQPVSERSTTSPGAAIVMLPRGVQSRIFRSPTIAPAGRIRIELSALIATASAGGSIRSPVAIPLGPSGLPPTRVTE